MADQAPDMSMFGSNPAVSSGPDMSMFQAAPEKPKPKSDIRNIGRGLEGAFNQAVTSNLMIQPVRWAMQAADFGGYKQKLKDKFPGKDEAWYDTQMDKVYNQAITSARQSAAKQTAENPYPGHQVGNFVAGVVGSADPTWLIAPGASASKNVVTHVAKQAAVQGGLAGLTDLAAQGLDAAAGMENEYDPKRNLEAIAMGGAFGGGFAGVQAGIHSPKFQEAVAKSNTPDFVKKAFTLPTPEVQGPEFKSQVGAASTVNTPELIAKQKEVFAKGTADDIHAFYDEVGGPRPSNETVDKWLQTREQLGVPAAPKPDVLEAQVHKDNLRAHIDNETKTWKNKPDVNIIDTLDDMSPEVRETATKDGITPDNTVGFLGSDGKVHIFANQIKTPEAASAVLFHEALGHYGLAQKFGSKLDSTLKTLVARNVGQFGKKVDQWVAANPGAYGGNKLRAAEEVLAEMSQSGPLPKSIGDAVVAGVRQFARSMGVDLKYSDAEISHILSMAHDAVIKGKGRDVVGNRFGGLNYQATDFGQNSESRQMYAGENAHGNLRVPEDQWFEGPDGKRRFEISDHNARWDDEHSSLKGTADLDEVLIHPSLFKAYPELHNVKVVRDVSGVGSADSVQGYFDPDKGQLHISPLAEDPKSTALHELQHWIQFKEGFAFGGSRDTVRLDNQKALNKLQQFYERELENVQATGFPEAKTFAHVRNPGRTIANRLEQVNELKQVSKELTGLYKTADDMERTIKAHTIKVKRLRDEAKAKSDMVDLLSGSDKSFAEKTQAYTDFTEANKKYLEAIEVRRKTKERFDKVLDGLTGIKGKYTDLTFDLYNLLTGEVEARDVQARRNLTPEERAEIRPFTMEGIQPEEMIPVTNTGAPMESRQMTPEQLQRQLDNGTADIEQLENTYNRVYAEREPEVRSDAAVRRAAVDAGLSPAKVKKAKDMEDLSARIYRAQEAAKTLDERLAKLADKEGTPGWSVKDADDARKAIADHYYILNRLYDDKSELGRALRIAKLGYTHAEMRAYKELLAEEGGTLAPLSDDETLSRFLRSYKTLAAGGANPNGVNALVMGLKKPNWEEYLLSARTNMMLSGMSTHVTAVTDMIDGIGYDLMDSTAGLIPSLGREGLRALGFKNVKQGIHPAEVGARYWGVLRAAMDAGTYVNALNTLKNGSSRVTSGGRQYARIPILGKVGDLIAAEDQFFRAFSTNMHLYGLGVRKAVQEARAAGKKPSMDDLITQGVSYARSPDKELLKQAENAAEENLLLAPNMLVTPLDTLRRSGTVGPNATPQEKAVAGAQRATSFIINFMLPFVRTATNSLYQRVWRRTPLTMLDPKTLGDLHEGGIKADIAMGRIMLGTASVALAWAAAGRGEVSGEGPDSPYKKAIKMATGWRPKSVKVEGPEGTRYNINQNLGNRLNIFDMNSQTATMVASLKEAYDKGANEGQVATGMKMAVYSTLKNLSDNVWLGDIADTINIMSQPGVNATDKRDQWVANQVASFTPNLLSQVARVQDQGQPMTTESGDLGQTIVNTLKSRIPGQREDLPDRMTPFGTPVQSGTSMAGQTTILPQGNRVTGGAYIDQTTDPAELEIARLDEIADKAVVTSVRRNIKIDGETIRLNNEELSKYQEAAGRQIVDNVREMMSTSDWASMSDEEKVDWIHKMQTKVKKETRVNLFGGDE